jgi:hypothetical protein
MLLCRPSLAHRTYCTLLCAAQRARRTKRSFFPWLLTLALVACAWFKLVTLSSTLNKMSYQGTWCATNDNLDIKYTFNPGSAVRKQLPTFQPGEGGVDVPAKVHAFGWGGYRGTSSAEGHCPLCLLKQPRGLATSCVQALCCHNLQVPGVYQLFFSVLMSFHVLCRAVLCCAVLRCSRLPPAASQACPPTSAGLWCMPC